MLTKIWEIYDLEKIEKVKQREIPRFRHRGIRSLMRGEIVSVYQLSSFIITKKCVHFVIKV